jgi:hypothetical protein
MYFERLVAVLRILVGDMPRAANAHVIDGFTVDAMIAWCPHRSGRFRTVERCQQQMSVHIFIPEVLCLVLGSVE